MGLPGELRNMVYSRMFGESKPVRSRQVKQKISDRQFVTKFSFRRGDNPGRVSTEGWLKATRSVIDTPGILYVCRQVNIEVSTMLYGDTPFIFATTSVLAAFAKSAGSMIQYLRIVKFDTGFLKKVSKDAARYTLTRASGLRQLVFKHKDLSFGVREIGDDEGAAVNEFCVDIVCLFYTVFMRLHNIRKNTLAGSDVLNIVRVEYDDPGRSQGTPIAKDVAEVHCRSLRALVNKHIADLLELPSNRCLVSGVGICGPGTHFYSTQPHEKIQLLLDIMQPDSNYESEVGSSNVSLDGSDSDDV